MLGYALFNMLYGSARTAEFARIDLGQALFVFTLYKVLLGLKSCSPSATTWCWQIYSGVRRARW